MPKKNFQPNILRQNPTQFQGSFVDFFLKTGSPPFHLLIAPPGSGKTFTSMTLVAKLLAEKLRRFLIIIPVEALTDRWHWGLEGLSDEVPISFVSRSDFREMESDTPLGENPWKEGINILTVHTIKHEDVANSIIRASWDLVVVDEAHNLSEGGRKILSKVLKAGLVKRLLLLTATPPNNMFSDMIEGLAITDWKSKVERRPELIEKRIYSYKRNTAELEFLNAIKTSKDNLGLLYDTLLNQAASSIYTAEKLLIFLSDVTDWEEGTKSLSMDTIKHLLNLIDDISHDTKIDALKSLIEKLRSHDSNLRACIVSQDHNTYYVWESLFDLDFSRHLFVEMLTVDLRQEAYKKFKEEGGLLVSDAAFIEGYDFGFVDIVIFYDLPKDDGEMAQIEGRFNCITRTKPFTFYAFLDKSEILVSEKVLLEKYGFISPQAPYS